MSASAFAASDVNYKCTKGGDPRVFPTYYLKINKGTYWKKGFFAYSVNDQKFSNDRNIFDLGDGYETAGYLCFENGVADMTFRVKRRHHCLQKIEAFKGKSEITFVKVSGGYEQTDLSGKAAHYEHRSTIPCTIIN